MPQLNPIHKTALFLGYLLCVLLYNYSPVLAQIDSTSIDEFDISFDEDFFGESTAQFISNSELEHVSQLIFIKSYWKFSNTDDPKWALTDSDDSSLAEINTTLYNDEIQKHNWKGIGWFRYHIRLDSALADRTLGLIISHHFGASEIYIDGKKIASIGKINSPIESSEYNRTNRPIPIHFNGPGHHLIAVRYANHNSNYYLKEGFKPGFDFNLGDYQYHLQNWLDIKSSKEKDEIFTLGALLAITLVHFLLFIFYPLQKNNFYFALFTGILAFMTFAQVSLINAILPSDYVMWFKLSNLLLVVAMIGAQRFSYELFYAKAPVYYPFILSLGAFLCMYYWFSSIPFLWPKDLFVLIITADMFRGLWFAYKRSKPAIWIIGMGLSCFMLGIIISVLSQFYFGYEIGDIAQSAGIAMLITTMSVFLSYNVATINKSLKRNLVEVKQLSRKAIEQESLTRKKELERKILAVENSRKSEELNQARELQLSMLPNKLPEKNGLNVAVHMDTAYEVGGDYYDFANLTEHSFTGVVGDATGHGMRSGIVVATVKSHFFTLAQHPSLTNILDRISLGVRNMGLKTTFMSLLVYRFNTQNGIFEFASAGMPPILVYRAASQQVDSYLHKAFPLGTKISFEYKVDEFKLEDGDCVLILTDGLMELFNSKREILGLDRIVSHFKNIGNKNSQQIVNEMRALALSWAGKENPNDDITVVCLKKEVKLFHENIQESTFKKIAE